MSKYSHVKAMIAKFSSAAKVIKSQKEIADTITHNIILIGETGVGKSTLINSLVNYLTFNDYERAKQSEPITRLIGTSYAYFDDNDEYKTIKAFDDDNEIVSDWESATQKPKQYNLNFGNNVCLRIIDTPGLCDTRDTNSVNAFVESLMKIIMSYKEITAICVVMKSDENARYNNTFHRIKCLIQLFSRLHYSIEENLVFIFTYGKTTNFSALISIRFINKFFDAIKMKLKITRDNSFVFDNDVYNYLLALGHNIELDIIDPKMSWQMSSEMSKNLINHLLTLKPHNIQQTVEVNKYCKLIEKLTAELMITTHIMEQIPKEIHLKYSGILDMSKTSENNTLLLPKSNFGKLLCNNCHKNIYNETKIVEKVEEIEKQNHIIDENFFNGEIKSISTLNSKQKHKTHTTEQNAIIKALALFHYHRKENSLCKHSDYFKKHLLERLNNLKEHNCERVDCIKEILEFYKMEKIAIKANSKIGVTFDDLENAKNIIIKLKSFEDDLRKIYRSMDRRIENLEISDNDYIDIPFYEMTSYKYQTKQMADIIENIELQTLITDITATAIYDFKASDCDEISFDPNDIITNISMVDNEWWIGMCRGVYGMFPANYVRLDK